MKKVAGRLRLDLAQYRELEAFSQFGSELDASTQQALARGERMVATLNQPQYQPWPFEEQVVSIYAGINGYLDKVPVSQVPRFHAELRETLRSPGGIYDAIRESQGHLRRDGCEARGGADEVRRLVRRRRGEGPGRLAPMASVQDLKRRIRSVRNTRKITRAMELVAASKLRRAQVRIEAMRPYALTMQPAHRRRRPRGGLLCLQPPAAPAARGAPNTVLLVPLTGDRGLAGAFNAQVLRRSFRARTLQLQAEGKTVRWLAIGKKGRSTLTFRRRELDRRVRRLHRPARGTTTSRRSRTVPPSCS